MGHTNVYLQPYPTVSTCKALDLQAGRKIHSYTLMNAQHVGTVVERSISELMVQGSKVAEVVLDSYLCVITKCQLLSPLPAASKLYALVSFRPRGAKELEAG